MKKQCGFVPRMFQVINTVTPEPGRTFADFYASIFADGALSRKVKELMFMSGGVAYCSPRCIIHVIPAINAGATTMEIFEAASVGMILGGFVPGGPGIPYAFEYALKVPRHRSKVPQRREMGVSPAAQVRSRCILTELDGGAFRRLPRLLDSYIFNSFNHREHRGKTYCM